MKKLDCKSLMIGDWVQDRSGAKMKIMNIEYHCTRVLYNGEEFILACFEQANLRPIPLTPEILEKNGFNVKKYSDGEYYADIMFEDRCRRVEIDYRYGVDIDVCVIGHNNTPPFSRIETQVRYIHELQHIFKILKIDKEIAL